MAFSVHGVATFVSLGNATNFTILGQSTITDVPGSGTTILTGDVGLSPATGAGITGLSCSQMTLGTIYTVDAAYTGGFDADTSCNVIAPVFLGLAVLDEGAAYTAATGQTSDFALPASMAGLTLAPGVWTNAGAVTLPVGTTVTLNGSASDVWVFQIAGTLTFFAGSTVAFIGGAQASNVFWATGMTTALLASANVSGTIISSTDITFVSGATLNGRALAGTAVTMDNNTLSLPAAASPVCTNVTVSPSSASLTVGSILLVNASALDQFGSPFATNFTFSSNNTLFATVNSTTGNVTGISPGLVGITALCSSGANATSNITVIAAPVPPPSGGNSGGRGGGAIIRPYTASWIGNCGNYSNYSNSNDGNCTYVTPSLRSGQKVFFTMNNQQYSLTVLSAYDDRVKLRVQGVPDFMVYKNETTLVDLNHDGRDDLALSIVNLGFGTVVLRMKNLVATAASPPPFANKQETQTAKEDQTTVRPQPAPVQPASQPVPNMGTRRTEVIKAPSSLPVPLIIGIVLVIGVAAYTIIRQIRKRK